MKYINAIFPFVVTQAIDRYVSVVATDMNISPPVRNRGVGFDSATRNLGLICGDWEKNRRPLKGESDLNFFGGAVATSADGLTIAIGSSQGEDASEPARSYVKVYTQRRSTGFSTQMGNTITGVPSAGRDVSLSSDGQTIAIANIANENNGKVSGEVNVYEYVDSDKSWKRLGGKIIVDGSFHQTRASVELSGDGRVLVFGASGSGFDVYGKTRVFRYDATNRDWIRKGRNILENGDGTFASVEVSTSISKDGDTIAIGSSREGNEGNFISRVRVFQYDSGKDSWERKGLDLFGSHGGDFFGASVALGHDGNTLAVGSDGANDNRGNVKIFKYESKWTQIGQTISGQEENTYFGKAMALSTSDENMVVLVGSLSGAEVFQYRSAKKKWEMVGNTMTVTTTMQMLGASVAMSENGKRIVVGLPIMNSSNGRNTGIVQTYELNDETCRPTSSPTVQPTKSAIPSRPPTTRPTLSISPSHAPTLLPSNAPSQSLEPSVSSFPTSGPTVAPTVLPTMKPTNLPTSVPTDSPTTKPSAKPSLGPVAAPSPIPTLIPSLLPTMPPSNSPRPTPSPSSTPSRNPTFLPTVEPTNAPSPSPSKVPTTSPTTSAQPSLSTSPSANAVSRISNSNIAVEVDYSAATEDYLHLAVIFGAIITTVITML